MKVEQNMFENMSVEKVITVIVLLTGILIFNKVERTFVDIV